MATSQVTVDGQVVSATSNMQDNVHRRAIAAGKLPEYSKYQERAAITNFVRGVEMYWDSQDDVAPTPYLARLTADDSVGNKFYVEFSKFANLSTMQGTGQWKRDRLPISIDLIGERCKDVAKTLEFLDSLAAVKQ